MSFRSTFERLLTSKKTHNAVGQLNFVRRRKDIRETLYRSHESGGLVGVYCEAFGEGMFLTAVEDIYDLDGTTVVSFYPIDQNGVPLLRNEVELGEIKLVCRFTDKYRNPLLERCDYIEPR